MPGQYTYEIGMYYHPARQFYARWKRKGTVLYDELTLTELSCLLHFTIILFIEISLWRLPVFLRPSIKELPVSVWKILIMC